MTLLLCCVVVFFCTTVVDFKTLKKQYPFIAMLKTLLGAAPNCTHHVIRVKHMYLSVAQVPWSISIACLTVSFLQKSGIICVFLKFNRGLSPHVGSYFPASFQDREYSGSVLVQPSSSVIWAGRSCSYSWTCDVLGVAVGDLHVLQLALVSLRALQCYHSLNNSRRVVFSIVPNAIMNESFVVWAYWSSRLPIALSCTMALRRGLREDAIKGVDLTEAESAAWDLGKALGTQPCKMEYSIHSRLVEHVGKENAEWTLHGTCMMGWLGRFMDMMGVDMEEILVTEVESLLRPTGWSTGRHAVAAPQDALQEALTGPPRRGDNLGAYCELVVQTPSAFMYDRRSLAGIPSSWPAGGEYLQNLLGYNFPVLGRLHHARARCGYIAAIKDNLVSDECQFAKSQKYALAVMFSMICKNVQLEEIFLKLYHREQAANLGSGDDDLLAVARSIAESSDMGVVCDGGWVENTLQALETSSTSPNVAGAFMLAAAGSTSPGRVGPEVVQAVKLKLAPAEIVEVVSWLGVLTLFNRLMSYFAVVPEE